jgi:aryl-alcohol dehydrogenase-like predicted oxidoreductase
MRTHIISTANNYQDGDAETWLGEWITKKGIRDEVIY